MRAILGVIVFLLLLFVLFCGMLNAEECKEEVVVRQIEGSVTNVNRIDKPFSIYKVTVSIGGTGVIRVYDNYWGGRRTRPKKGQEFSATVQQVCRSSVDEKNFPKLPERYYVPVRK